MAEPTSRSLPDPPGEIHDPAATRHNSRLGLIFFAIYVVLYGGFVALNTFEPSVMAKPAIAGVNLAIVYGVALIVAALVLAPIYMVLCRPVSGGAEKK